MVKNSVANTGDIRDEGSIHEQGQQPGRGNGTPLQYSCLENPLDRGTWQAAVHSVTKRHNSSDLRCPQVMNNPRHLLHVVNIIFIYLYILIPQKKNQCFIR